MHFINEDFSSFPIGELPYDKAHSALGEYHTFTCDGFFGPFYDPISLHQWRSMDGSWLIVSAQGKKHLEQNRGNYTKDAFTNVYAMLVTKEKMLANYLIKTSMQLYSDKEMAGICFNYATSREYDCFGFSDGKAVIWHRSEEKFIVLAEKEFAFECNVSYELQVIVGDSLVEAYVNDELIISAQSKRIDGRSGFVSKSACRFDYFIVEYNEVDWQYHQQMNQSNQEKLASLQAQYSPMELQKVISLNGFGSGRQLRIFREGRMTYFLFAQHQKRIMRDSFARISGLALFDLDGNLVWQKGNFNPDKDNTLISCDLPFQVSDINNDGKKELIYSVDFKLYIADALSGKIINEYDTPIVTSEMDKDYPFKRLNVDAIRVADFRGLGYQGDLILKDRYKNVFAVTSDMKNIFHYKHKNTGHFPYIYDFNGDGKDEMFVGYDYVSSEGKILASLPMNSDHTDEIIYLSTRENEPKRLYLASGNEGFNICDLDGNIIKHNEVGHAQRISIANYDSNSSDLQIIVTSFWGSDGIVHSFDSQGNRAFTKEYISNGVLVSPVSYDGIHSLCLINSTEEGGLVDFELNQVVSFPQDKHPVLACEVFDIDDDGIDEILCFDQYELWIYKAKNTQPCRVIAKYPDNAFSNYRGEYLITCKK